MIYDTIVYAILCQIVQSHELSHHKLMLQLSPLLGRQLLQHISSLICSASTV